MNDRARAATSRTLSCTLLSRHGEKKTEDKKKEHREKKKHSRTLLSLSIRCEKKIEGKNESHQETRTHTQLTHVHKQRGGGRVEESSVEGGGWKRD
jgi:hypothetical protein